MIRQISEKIDYIEGTVKAVKKFAWLPKVVGEYKIWLISYEQMYVYRIEVIPAMIDGKPKDLIKKHWYLVDERVI